jgi:Protein of unknown function (DUF3142)
MSFVLPFRSPSSRNTQMACVAIGLLVSAVAIANFKRRPHPWRANEVPVAFWSWRNQTPSEADVRAAVETTNAHAIFLRAGQIDFQDGKLSRIRSVQGPLPKGIDLHFVYNATRSLLAQLENVDERTLAGSIAEAFQEDAHRAEHEHARVVGLQIDFDVPTRLLSRYEETLSFLRAKLPPGTKLSITGLPTWMQSNELRMTLAQVDFWVPQFYGAEIPERSDQLIPISSATDVERFVNSARELNKPFYAGLAAYSCALLYRGSGALITLRGDMDPTTIAADQNLELIDQKTFGANKSISEWRYAYRARMDGVTDGLSMHAGDVLVIDTPSAESLRASARSVRELAGEKLLGICVFRLPALDDPAALTVEQVAGALADRDSAPDFKIRFHRDEQQARVWLLQVENQGTASAIGGLKIDVLIEPGTVEALTAHGGATLETICRVFKPHNTFVDQPCSPNRANVIRLVASGLRPGQGLSATLSLKTTLPHVVPISIETQTDAGRPYLNRREILVEGN